MRSLKRVLIITDAQVLAGSYQVAYAENAFAAMGVETRLQYADATNPTVARINAIPHSGDDPANGIDAIVLPDVYSANYSALARLFGGTVTKPVLWGGRLSGTAELKGSDPTGDYGGSVKHLAMFTDNNADGYVHQNQWAAMNQTLVLPAKVTPFIEALSDLGTGKRLMCAWKYTPDGVNYVYHHKVSHARYVIWNFLVQQAINDGWFSAPLKKAPMFLMIDHINADGANNVGGTTENPGLLDTWATFLRKIGGVCYTNWDRRYAPGGSIGDKTTGLLANTIKKHLDVFKIIACHDHTAGSSYLTESNSPDDPFTKSLGKPGMDAAYQATKTSMESFGIPVSTDLAHFGNNLVPMDWYELGSADVSHRSSPDNLTIKAGYGFKFARVGGVNASFPHFNANTSSIPCRHFMKERVIVRGITVFPTSEMDNLSLCANQLDQTIANSRHDLTIYLSYAMNFGLMGYVHPLGFEDVAWRTANVAGAPTTASNGSSTSTQLFDALERMWSMAKRCPDTMKLGANCLNYLP